MEKVMLHLLHHFATFEANSYIGWKQCHHSLQSELSMGYPTQRINLSTPTCLLPDSPLRIKGHFRPLHFDKKKIKNSYKDREGGRRAEKKAKLPAPLIMQRV